MDVHLRVGHAPVSGIIGKFNDSFVGFNSKINSIVSKALSRLGVTVIDDKEDEQVTGEVDDKTKSLLKDKNKLMIDSGHAVPYGS